MRIARAKYMPRQAMIEVAFENGDQFVVAVESLLSSQKNGVVINWNKLRISETKDVLEAPTRSGKVEIPWDRIRSIVDPAYRAHIADLAADRAQEIGKRIRAMRLELKLTRGDLADKIGATKDVIANLESGKLNPPLDLLERIGKSFGKPLRDFANA